MSNIFSSVPSIFAFLLIIISDFLCSAQKASNKPEVVLDDDDDDHDHDDHHHIEWWQILLIVILIIFLVVTVAVILIRRYGIKKRQKKIDNFKEAYDKNEVQKQMRNLYDIAPRLAKNNSDYKISPLTELEPTYSSKQTHLNHINIHDNINSYDNRNINTYHDSNITYPPSYERKDNDAFSKRQKLKRSSTLGSMNRKVRYYLDNDDEGFEIVVADKGVKTSPRTLLNEGYYTGDNNLSRSNSTGEKANNNNGSNFSTTNYYY